MEAGYTQDDVREILIPKLGEEMSERGEMAEMLAAKLAAAEAEVKRLTAPAKPDPLGVRCVYCGVTPGERCRIQDPKVTVGRAVYGPGQFHAARVRLAEKEADHG